MASSWSEELDGSVSVVPTRQRRSEPEREGEFMGGPGLPRSPPDRRLFAAHRHGRQFLAPDGGKTHERPLDGGAPRQPSWEGGPIRGETVLPYQPSPGIRAIYGGCMTDRMDNRAQISEFLATRRARLTPEQVGLPTGARRRVPGLRREEVAMLAGVSTDWYIRLERGHIAEVSE